MRHWRGIRAFVLAMFTDDDRWEVVPCDVPQGWFTVLYAGAPVWHAPSRPAADRYASDPEYRESLRATPLHLVKPT